MRILKSLALTLGLIAGNALYAQSPGQVTAQPGNLAGILYASSFGQWQVPQGNQGQFSWSSASFCTRDADGFYLNPVFQVGTPITIVDQNPANTEIVIPTAVSISGSGCSITVAPTHPHNSFYLKSGTAGLQEAINYAKGLPYQVVVSPDWTRLGGVTSMFTAAVNGLNVGVVDWRTNCPVPYSWTGSNFLAGPSWCSGGGGSGCISAGPIGTFQASDGLGGCVALDANFGVASANTFTFGAATNHAFTVNGTTIRLNSSSPTTLLGNGSEICTLATGCPTTTGVTDLSAGNLPPLFTTNVATPDTTPVLTFSLSPTPDATLLGNFSGGVSAPQYTRLIAGSNIMLAEGGGGSSLTISTAGQPQIQVNDSATGVSQAIVDFNSTLPAAPSGNINVTWQNDTATGRKSAYVPALSATFQPLLTPAPTGQFVYIYPTAVACGPDDNPRTQTVCSANGSASIFSEQFAGTFPPAGVTVDFSGFALPAGIPSGNVTSVQAFGISESSGVGQIFTADACGSAQVIPGTGSWQLTPVTASTSITGATVPSTHCVFTVSNSGSQIGASGFALDSVGLIIHYTGSPVTTPNVINIGPYLSWNAATSTLSTAVTFPSWLNGVPVAQLPSATNLFYQLELVRDGTSSTDCSVGGGTTPVLCWANGTSWTAFAGGGGSGVTWPASSDLVVSNSTNSPAGLAPVNGDCVVGSGGVWVAGSCAGTTASNVTVNGGSTLPTANFNATTPAAGAGNQNLVFQTSTTNVSVEVPFGTNSVPGIMQADGASLSSAAGLISCATATTSQKGCMRPDGSTITIVGEVISAVGAAISGGSAGQVAIFGSATTITSGVTLGNTGTNIPRLSGGLLAASILPLATTSTFGVIEPDNTSCTVSAGILSCSGGGGGGGLPTATQPGQTYASVAAGTTGAVVPQIFYNQTGDTIGSIESECSSVCTYIVTQPQTITLGSSHAMNANVTLLFQSGGKWTVNGAFTLSNIQVAQASTLTQHFAGTSTISLSGSVAFPPVEWFGAIGDWNGSTGTDNTVPIQLCLNAVTGNCLLQGLPYKVTNTLTVTASNKGLYGTLRGSSGYGGTSSQTIIINTSASATTIDFHGTNVSTQIYANELRNIDFQRSVAPTGTATGVSLAFLASFGMDGVVSEDSIQNFYLKFLPFWETGGFSNSTAVWGRNGVSSSGTLYGWYFDSTTGGFNSIRLSKLTAVNVGQGTTSYGFYFSGANNTDIEADGLETASVSYGIYLTGGGQDANFSDSILDDCIIDCAFISGQSTAIISGKWMAPRTGATAGVEVTGSKATTITGVAIWLPTGVTGVYGHATTNMTASSNTITGLGTGSNTAVLFNNVSASSVIGNSTGQSTNVGSFGVLLQNGSTGNSVTGNSFTNGVGSNALTLQGSSGNSISDNSCTGTSGGWCVNLDATSNNNHYANLNSVSSASPPAVFVADAGTGNQLASFSNPMTTLGDTIYGGASGAATRLAGPTTNAHQFVFGAAPTGSAVAPAWLDLGTYLGANITGTSPISTTPSTLGTALSCPTCDTSGSLTTNSLPKATGAHALSNSLFTDNGTNGAYGGTGTFTVPSLIAGSGATGCGSATGCIALGEASTAGTPTAANIYIRADSTTNSLLASLNGSPEAPIAIRLPAGSVTFTPGAGVTSATCATSYTCTNSRGEFTLVGGTATTGTIATVNFSATLGAAPFCTVSVNGNGGSSTTFFDLGHGLPSTSSFTVTSGITVIGATINIDYQCGQ